MVYCCCFQTDSHCFLIGLQRRSQEHRNFTWEDGTNFEEFQGMISLEPGFYESNEKCVCFEKLYQQIVARTWNCLAYGHYICQKRTSENGETKCHKISLKPFLIHSSFCKDVGNDRVNGQWSKIKCHWSGVIQILILYVSY